MQPKFSRNILPLLATLYTCAHKFCLKVLKGSFESNLGTPEIPTYRHWFTRLGLLAQTLRSVGRVAHCGQRISRCLVIMHAIRVFGKNSDCRCRTGTQLDVTFFYLDVDMDDENYKMTPTTAYV